jgi:hypothetical protein
VHTTRHTHTLAQKKLMQIFFGNSDYGNLIVCREEPLFRSTSLVVNKLTSNSSAHEKSKMASQSNRLGDSVAEYQVSEINQVDVRECEPGSRARPVKRAGVLKLINAIDEDGYDKVHQLYFNMPTDNLFVCRMSVSP